MNLLKGFRRDHKRDKLKPRRVPLSEILEGKNRKQRRAIIAQVKRDFKKQGLTLNI